MTQSEKNIASTIAAFKIAMDRAFEKGLTPDQFVSSMFANKDSITNLAKSCNDYYEKAGK